jgi:hypothetical protein
LEIRKQVPAAFGCTLPKQFVEPSTDIDSASEVSWYFCFLAFILSWEPLQQESAVPAGYNYLCVGLSIISQKNCQGLLQIQLSWIILLHYSSTLAFGESQNHNNLPNAILLASIRLNRTFSYFI